MNNADEYEVSSNGKEVAFVHRGEVFVTSIAEGTTRRITNTPEQERNVSFHPDGRTLLYNSLVLITGCIHETAILLRNTLQGLMATVQFIPLPVRKD